jgi:dTDP-3-amino-3,4,6-trideoxy-alpha-D-glucose transaminase
VPAGGEPVHHLYVTRAESPDTLAERLERAGIATRSYYRTPVHRQPPMAPYAAGAELPGTEAAAATNLALPMGPTLGEETARAVVAALEGA